MLNSKCQDHRSATAMQGFSLPSHRHEVWHKGGAQLSLAASLFSSACPLLTLPVSFPPHIQSFTFGCEADFALSGRGCELHHSGQLPHSEFLLRLNSKGTPNQFLPSSGSPCPFTWSCTKERLPKDQPGPGRVGGGDAGDPNSNLHHNS